MLSDKCRGKRRAALAGALSVILCGFAGHANAQVVVDSDDKGSVYEINEDSTTIEVYNGGTLTISGGAHGTLNVSDGGKVTFEGMYVAHTPLPGADPVDTAGGSTLEISESPGYWDGVLTYRYKEESDDSYISVDTLVDLYFTVASSSENQPPVAADDNAFSPANAPISIDVLANDSDADNDSLSVVSVTSPANGSVLIDDEGGVTYTPSDPLFLGTDTFDYTVSDGSATATATVTVRIGIPIDVKPGSDPNPINQGANGVIPVAILTTDYFNAAAVDPSTAVLNGAGVAVRGKSEKQLARLEDVDGDGDEDLMLQMDTQSWADLGEDGWVTLTGLTYEQYGSQEITGKDYVVIVP